MISPSKHTVQHWNLLFEDTPLGVVDEVPEGHRCGECAYYVRNWAKCSRTGREVAPLMIANCYTKERTMEEIQEVNTTTDEASAPAMRVCKACGRELPLEEFVNKKGGGKGHVCRDCWRERCTHTQKGEDNNKRSGEKAIEEGVVGLALNGILPDAARMEEMMAATWQSSVLRDAFCRACAMKEKDGKVYPETIIKSFSSSSAARLRKLQREHAGDGKAAPKVTKDKSVTLSRKDKAPAPAAVPDPVPAPDPTAPDLAVISDADMVTELRRRGWEVKCSRVTVTEL